MKRIALSAIMILCGILLQAPFAGNAISITSYNADIRHFFGEYSFSNHGNDEYQGYIIQAEKGQQPSVYTGGLMPHEIGWEQLNKPSFFGGWSIGSIMETSNHIYIDTPLSYYARPGDSEPVLTLQRGYYAVRSSYTMLTLNSYPTDSKEWRYFNVLMPYQDEYVWRKNYEHEAKNNDNPLLFEEMGGAYYVKTEELSMLFQPEEREQVRMDFALDPADGSNYMTYMSNKLFATDIKLYCDGLYISPNLYRQVEWTPLNVVLLTVGVALIVGGAVVLVAGPRKPKHG